MEDEINNGDMGLLSAIRRNKRTLKKISVYEDDR